MSSRLIRWVPAFVLFLASAAQAGPGVFLGVNFGSVQQDSTTPTSGATGLVMGFEYDFPVGPWLSLVPVGQFAQRGFSFDVGNQKVTFTRSYFEHLLLLRMRFVGRPAEGETEPVTPYFELGPNLGMRGWSSCKAETTVCYVDFDLSPTVALGVDFGLGIKFPMEDGGAFAFGARYHYGVTNLTNSALSTASMRNRGLMVTAGYDF